MSAAARTFVVSPTAAAGRRWCVANRIDPAAALIVTPGTRQQTFILDAGDHVQYVPGWAGDTERVTEDAPADEASPWWQGAPAWVGIVLAAGWVAGMATMILLTLLIPGGPR